MLHTHPGFYGISEERAAELRRLDYAQAKQLTLTREFRFWWLVVQGWAWTTQAAELSEDGVVARRKAAEQPAPSNPVDVVDSLQAALTAALNEPRPELPSPPSPDLRLAWSAPCATERVATVSPLPPPAAVALNVVAHATELAGAPLAAEPERKAKRGRPPKPKPAETMPKRPRGRPRKAEAEA